MFIKEAGMSETLSVIFDGEVFRPEVPLNLKPNTRYQITLESELQPDNSPSNLSSVRQSYHFKDQEQIQQFLANNSPLVEFLLNAVEPIKHYFPQARLELKLAPAEEVGDEDKLLVVIHA